MNAPALCCHHPLKHATVSKTSYWTSRTEQAELEQESQQRDILSEIW